MNRRDFLFTATAATMLGLTGCAGVKISPFAWRQPAKPRVIAPGDKIRLAQIGFGGKGASDINQFPDDEVVALCDVDWSLGGVKSTAKKFPNAKHFTDYREMLLTMGDQIDAVIVSTPDHMHFLPAYMAVCMGKHVYVQKPLTQTIGEARELLKAVRRHGVCTQMGNQGHAKDDLRQFKEWIQAGIIGDVKEVHVWTNRPIWPQAKEVQTRPDPTDPPKDMKWDLWLGRAQERPFNKIYHPFKWRGWLDFGSGALGDMGCHGINGPYYALELGTPLSVTAETSGLTPEVFPEWSIVTYQFPATDKRPGLTLKWYDGGKLPERPAELEASRKLNPGGGQLIIGTKGTILSQSETISSVRLIPESKMTAMAGKFPEPSIPRVPNQNHYLEWAAAIRAGKPQATGTQFEYAVPLLEIVQLGNIALHAPGEKLVYDSQKMKIISHPKLNKLLSPTYRKGWKPRRDA